MTEGSGRPPRGAPNWPVLATADPRPAQAFYRALFGWESAESTEFPNEDLAGYRMFTLNGRHVAGVLPHPEPDVTESWWHVYFNVTDCDAVAERARRAGGLVAMDPTDVGSGGRAATVVDPLGAEFGVWESHGSWDVSTRVGPGSPVWYELLTPDTAASRGFYTSVFGHLITPLKLPFDVPDLDYWEIRAGDGPAVAGLHSVAGAVGSRWTVYFAVADMDAAVRAVGAHGGTVRRRPLESVYGLTAHVADPFGADFAIIQMAENPPR